MAELPRLTFIHPLNAIILEAAVSHRAPDTEAALEYVRMIL